MENPLPEDRAWLESKFLPSLNGNVLYVGVAEYTAGYEARYPNIGRFVTVDVDPERAKYGAKEHYICDMLDFNPKIKFDHVVLYGLWGLSHSHCNDRERMLEIINKSRTWLNDNGMLTIGCSNNYEWKQDYWHSFFDSLQEFENGSKVCLDIGWVCLCQIKMPHVFSRYLYAKRVAFVCAHHDDETMWGGQLIYDMHDRWDCVLNVVTEPAPKRADTFTRSPAFKRLCAKYRVRGDEWNFKDDYNAIDVDALSKRIRGIQCDIIFTHNECGEYGHGMHKLINEVVMKTRTDCDIVTFGYNINAVSAIRWPINKEIKKSLLHEYWPWTGEQYDFIYDPESFIIRRRAA